MEIHQAIEHLQLLVEKRHEDDKIMQAKMFEAIHNLDIKLAKLPCDSRGVQFDSIKAQINVLTVLVVSVIIGGIVLGVWIRAVNAGVL